MGHRAPSPARRPHCSNGARPTVSVRDAAPRRRVARRLSPTVRPGGVSRPRSTAGVTRVSTPGPPPALPHRRTSETTGSVPRQARGTSHPRSPTGATRAEPPRPAPARRV
ncbi:hypothetical protein STAFG_3261 [Streptomyces afghaniensis 772]|uniref:Uncharacterized protein n=1 Tax=Streptomyces afghaniensis 772 TaxID=1283301 RepID=S4MJG3_9ACTN|nr:hypothetical protein STAFG_3261 [Streptomyces afghaniensis 772]